MKPKIEIVVECLSTDKRVTYAVAVAELPEWIPLKRGDEIADDAHIYKITQIRVITDNQSMMWPFFPKEDAA